MKFSQKFDKLSLRKNAATRYPSNGFAGAQNWVGFCALDGRLRAGFLGVSRSSSAAKLTSGMGNHFAQSAQNWRGFIRRSGADQLGVGSGPSAVAVSLGLAAWALCSREMAASCCSWCRLNDRTPRANNRAFANQYNDTTNPISPP